ncbi:MAG: glutamate racemase [Lachnospiraceae bacterium]
MPDKQTMSSNRENPIAVFDSGVGGISVLKALVELMPNENYIYFGDSENAPYGTKSLDEVRELTLQHTNSLIQKGAKAIVIACNTATSAAIELLRDQYQLPVIGIEPALKPAVEAGDGSRILVLATPMTLREQKFATLMQSYQDQAVITSIPSPELVEFIERGELNSDRLHQYLESLFSPYSREQIGSVVLGCTHFPFAKKAIRKVLGDVPLYDGGAGTARETQRRLKITDMLNTSLVHGEVQIFNSLPGNDKCRLCGQLLISSCN